MRTVATYSELCLKSAFLRHLRRLFRVFIEINTFVALIYRQDQRPTLLYAWSDADRLYAPFHSSYLSRAYLLDPFFQFAKSRPKDGLYRLKNIAPDRFQQSAYYKSYFRQTGICDEVNFMVSLSNKDVLAISVTRDAAQGRFSNKDLSNLDIAAPMVMFWLRQHFGAIGTKGDQPTKVASAIDPTERIRIHSQRVTGTKLTQREAEIAALILKGHSTPPISANLGLSPATVKVHRRNIYRKLSISSQAELFSLLHGALTDQSISASP